MDNNDGGVLPAAIDRYVMMVIRSRVDDRVILQTLDLAAWFTLICEYWQVAERDDVLPLSGVTLGENSGFNCDGSVYFL